MKNKNLKGIIGLCFATASVLFVILALVVPMTKLTGYGFEGKLNYYGKTNIVFSVISIIFAAAAIVFGFLARKNKNKKVLRRTGLIIGLFAFVFGIFAVAAVSMLSSVTEFINSEGKTGTVAEIIKDDPDKKNSIDKIIKELQNKAGIPETGLAQTK